MTSRDWIFLIFLLIPLTSNADVVDFGDEKSSTYSRMPTEETLCQVEPQSSSSAESSAPKSLSYLIDSTNNAQRVSGKVVYSPDILVKTPDGWLLGGNRGEWGGEVVLKQGESLAYLVKENAIGIHKMPLGYVLVTGLSHMHVNYGHVYLLRSPLNLATKPILLFDLPTAPKTSSLLKNSRLLIQLRDSAFVMDQDATLHKVKCSNMQ